LTIVKLFSDGYIIKVYYLLIIYISITIFNDREYLLYVILHFILYRFAEALMMEALMMS